MFEDWSRSELQQLFLQRNIVVKNIQNVTNDALLTLAQKKFANLETEPPKPSIVYTPEEVNPQERASARVQSVAKSSVKRNMFKSIVKAVTEKGFIDNHMDVLKSQSLVAKGEIRFNDWTRYELLQGLVAAGIELRRESTTSDSTLKRIMTEVFKDKETPEKPPVLSMTDFRKFNKAAFYVQKKWRAKRGLRMLMKTISTAKHNALLLRSPAKKLVAVADDHAAAVDIDGNWVPPSLDRALEVAAQYMVRDGGMGGKEQYDLYEANGGRHCTNGGLGEQCDLWNEGKWSDFSPYGPGITNFFKFIKWGFWILLFTSIILIPTMIFNLNGTAIPQDTVSMMAVSRTMVGNLGDTFNASDAGIKIPGCSNKYYNVNCYVEKSDLAEMYSGIIFCIAFFVSLALIWLVVFEQKEADLDNFSLFASAYSIMVGNLPPDADENSLKEHFKKLVDCDIADLYFAYDNEDIIADFMARGEIDAQEKLYSVQNLYFKTISPLEGQEVSDNLKKRIADDRARNEKKREQVTKHIEYVKQRKKERQDKAGIKLGEHGTPVKAFVTFEETSAAEIVIKHYYRTMFSHFCVKPELLYKETLITVDKAPEPSTVIWENLAYTSLDRFWRMSLTNIIMICLIIIAMIVTFTTRVIQQSIENEGGSDECPVNFNSLSSEEQKNTALANKEILHCYCDTSGLDDDDNCGYYHQVQSWGIFVTLLASGIVSALNIALEYIIEGFAYIEKHSSLEEKEKVIFSRFFIFKFINMGLIFLINEDRFNVADIIGVNYEVNGNFSVSWYQTVGVTMTFVQLADIFIAHGFKFAVYWYQLYMRWAAQRDPLMALTQSQLNHLYLGPEFRISYDYGSLAVTLFVCLGFGGVMPLLPFFGCVNYAVSYWINKYFFTRLYRAPPRFNTDMNHYVTSFMPYTIILFLMLSIWALGNEEIFAASDTSSSKFSGFDSRSGIEQPHNLYLVIYLGLFIGCLFLWYFCNLFGGVLGSMLRSFFGDIYKYFSIKLLNDERKGILRLSYSVAMACGRFKNLATYNILHNPIYQELLHTTQQFANTHRYLDSIQEDHEARNTRTSLSEDDAKNLRESAVEQLRLTRAFQGNDIKSLSPTSKMTYFILSDLEAQTKREAAAAMAKGNLKRTEERFKFD